MRYQNLLVLASMASLNMGNFGCAKKADTSTAMSTRYESETINYLEERFIKGTYADFPSPNYQCVTHSARAGDEDVHNSSISVSDATGGYEINGQIYKRDTTKAAMVNRFYSDSSEVWVNTAVRFSNSEVPYIFEKCVEMDSQPSDAIESRLFPGCYVISYIVCK